MSHNLLRYIVLTIAFTERFFIREKMIKTRGQDHYSFWSDEAQNKLRFGHMDVFDFCDQRNILGERGFNLVPY